MPGPADFLAQIQQKKAQSGDDGTPSQPPSAIKKNNNNNNALLLASLQKRQNEGVHPPPSSSIKPKPPVTGTTPNTTTTCPPGKLFHYEESLDAFLLDMTVSQLPSLVSDRYGNEETDIRVPLAPCLYRMTDYTLAKKEPIARQRCILKLGVLRCLDRECDTLNRLLWHRLSPISSSSSLSVPPKMPSLSSDDDAQPKLPTKGTIPVRHVVGTMEEDELGKARFMELVSNCGVYQKVSELILQRASHVSETIRQDYEHGKDRSGSEEEEEKKNPYKIPQIHVQGLKEFLKVLDDLTPSLSQARQEVEDTQMVSFFPGLGELFTPGSKVVCFPDGMEGVAVGCSCVQSWYTEDAIVNNSGGDNNSAAKKVKRRFILVVEFLVSVGTELVFVAASEVYPEFPDPSRSIPIKDLTHRKLRPEQSSKDATLLRGLSERGDFYASVATQNHFLEYQPNSFYPIMTTGSGRNAALRPLSKGGRVMIDVKRGILEQHLPFRGTSGMSDTVKEAIKLFEQNKRTGIAVPFRTAILPDFTSNHSDHDPWLISNDGQQQPNVLGEESDRHQLWQAWPCLVGFSFTSRVWGKILLTLPKQHTGVVVDVKTTTTSQQSASLDSPRRASVVKMGVERAGLGGFGKCGSLNYINFQEKAFEQLVLEESKKELIRAVARNAGGAAKFDDDNYDGEDSDVEDDEDMGLDVVANKGAASIFLLNGPPGCGKTLTAEAIAELLKKPLYVITAGDLGITASEVEKTLGSVLELCQTWDALVLMDEADIFLEARSSTEIQRNALVCVMLRLLEYYSGCLFLSSNRPVSSIDPAIASRITVMLSYPPLDVAGRSKVWKNLVGLVPIVPLDESTGQMSVKLASNPRRASKYRVDFTADDFHGLATSYTINGRQIKNSIVLARALARERGVPLSLPILQLAVTAVAGDNGSP